MGRERHYTNRSNWLRAAVLGANDGILSTTSLVIGVAAAHTTRGSVILAALAGVVAGACSMAAGEYVSVRSQTDIENADLLREKNELETMPEAELIELSKIYESRGLDKELALQVAIQYTMKDALKAHARDELGINEIMQPKPLQAALASAASFIAGGVLPLLVAICAPLHGMVFFQYGFAIVFLAISGATAAKIGGCPIGKAVIRICFWGTVAMFITACVGYIFGAGTSLV